MTAGQAQDATDAEARRLGLLGSIFDVRDRSALVTGAGSGIGQAIAEVLAGAGAGVTVVDVSAESARATVDRIRAQGGRAGAVAADAGDVQQVEDAFDAAGAQFGLVDIVFANAGVSGGPGPQRGTGIEDSSEQMWERTLRTNLDGVFWTMRAAARRMRGRGGRIVVTSSVAGVRADPMVGYSYAASKAAVLNLVRQAALDLAGDDVLVNAIVPGPFRTNIGAPMDSPEKLAMDAVFAATVPLKRIADTSEMRGLALFLASPASSFVTGQAFAIDGGQLAGY